MCALPTPKPSSESRDAEKIKAGIDAMITRMQNEENFTPTREDLEKCAKQLVDYITLYHAKTAPYASHLKAAILDLTEVPEMAPQMQRLAMMTALKEASYAMQLYLSCL